MFKNVQHKPRAISHDDSIFQDLGLGKLFTHVCKLSGYNLHELNYQPLQDPKEITYRQQVFIDIEDPTVFNALQAFVQVILQTGKAKGKLKYYSSIEIRNRQFVNIIDSQIKAIVRLCNSLKNSTIHSQALKNFYQYLNNYIRSSTVLEIKAKLQTIHADFKNLNYQLKIEGRNVFVSSYSSNKETMGEEFKKIFSPLFDDPSKMLKPVKVNNSSQVSAINNLQVDILEELVKLYPKEFADLNNFYKQYSQYQENTIKNLVFEFEFYLSWAAIQKKIKEKSSLSFTLPGIITNGTEIIKDGFDLNLAINNQQFKRNDTVTNDFCLKPDKAFLIISGPNQGGKTTYARMVGQAYYLMNLGVPVPGSHAELKIKDNIFTHFDRQETSKQLNGLLESDIRRIHSIIERVNSKSFVILNELFSSTATADASQMGQRVLTKLIKAGATGIYVTFIESLGKHDHVQSMMSQVDSSGKRMYKVIPQKLNNRAYTEILLNNFSLTQSNIEKRLHNEN